jgi:hypothetical protein
MLIIRIYILAVVPLSRINDKKEVLSQITYEMRSRIIKEALYKNSMNIWKFQENTWLDTPARQNPYLVLISHIT